MSAAGLTGIAAESTMRLETFALIPLLLACDGLDPADTANGIGGVFGEAESASGVPAELLMAISRVETRFQMVEGEAEFPGQSPRYGWMALPEHLLDEASALTGYTFDELKYDKVANVRGAAALMMERADQLGIDERTDLEDWAPVVADYAGISDEEALAEYVHYEVYAALREGIATEDYAIDPMEVQANWPLPSRWGQRAGDGSAIWTASPNNSSRSGSSVDFVVIHTCEGSYSGCWGWLVNSSSGVSAHYVVNDDGTEVRQLVDEDRKAWHISANYDCSNNSGVECWRNGAAMNSVSVGIEHAGYGSQSSWHPGLIDRSSDLACGITQRHGIPRDAYHIVGHGQLQPWNRTDPGAAWPWNDYLNKIDVACGGGGGGGTVVPPSGGSGGTPLPGGSQFVIDSNNNANDTGSYYVDVSSDWWPSANVGGFYNTGYWVAPTWGVSDPASFWFYTSGTTCYQVDAWWSASWDRPPSITFIGWDAGENEVGRSTVNQQLNGGQWNRLGDWKFGPGWNRVLLSRWTSSGHYAVADAVRLTEVTCP